MSAKKKTAARKAPKKIKSFEETLWDTANKLRGSVESSDWSGATEPEWSGDSRRQTTRQGCPEGERGGANQYSRAERDRLQQAARRVSADARINHVVLSLIFLKFVSDKFEERRAELVKEGKEQYIDQVPFYTMQNVFYLPETSRWSYIQQHAKQGDIAIKIDSALTAVEASNASLKGALPDNYFSRLGLDGSKLSALTTSAELQTSCN